MSFTEKAFEVRGVRICLKHWHEHAPCKIIALHGWLDNAGSFDVIAPLMPECSIVAVDLAGQGLSDRRPASALYHLWDDLIDILAIADELGWESFTLMGHSRGAMLAVMLAASCPDRIRQLLLIDGLMPQPVKIEDAATQLANFIADNRRYTQQKHRYYKSREQAIWVRSRATGMSEPIINILASRQLRQKGGKWFWDYDQKLKSASAIKLTAEHNQAFLKAVQCPVLLVLADRGLGADASLVDTVRSFSNISYQLVEGHHHLHLGEQAREIADLFQGAIEKS